MMIEMDNQNRLITHDWTWPSVDKHKNCMSMYKISPKEIEKRVRVKVLIFGLYLYDVVVVVFLRCSRD